jgi:hypothetical protein
MDATTRKALGAAVALALLGAKPVKAANLRTPPIQPGVGQKLVCTVVNLDAKPLHMRAEVVDRFGDNATDFIRTDWDADETTVITLRAESSNPNARYCRITVTGGRKSDVAATLQACTFDETVCGDPVTAH